MNRFAEKKYLILLVTLMALLVVMPFLEQSPSERIIFDVLFTLVFLASLRVIFVDRRMRTIALVLGIPTLVGGWTGYFVSGVPRHVVDVPIHLISALFLGVGIASLLRAVYREKDVSQDALYAALSGYLITGLLFGHLYSIVDDLIPNAFNGMDAAGSREGNRHMVLAYFSFVTLTTVGYGDITPACAAGRSLAIVEAITGQFYLAVLIGELIGKRMSLKGREN